MTTVAQLLRPEPKRDRWGRYEIVPRDGGKAKAHTRATTWAKTLEDTYNLESWGNRMLALGLASRPDLLAGVASCTKDDKQDLNGLVKQAKEAAGAGSRAIIGTSLHRVTQRVDVGEEFVIPTMFAADLEAYQELLVKGSVRILPEYVERIVVLPELGVAGTYDRIVEHEGQLKIADVKTGDSVDYAWLAIAIQLALYANAESMYDPVTEIHELMPDVSKTEALVFHVPAMSGTAELFRVDLTVGWEAAQLCGKVRSLRNHKGLAELIELEPPASQGGSVTSAPSDEALSPEPETGAEAQAALAGETENRTEIGTVVPEDAPTPDERPSTSPETLLAVREWTKGRLAALIEAGYEDEARLGWPADMPTFKAFPDHTEDQLDRIIRLVQDIENAHQVRFPDDDPRITAVLVTELAELRAAEQRTAALIAEAFPGTTDMDAPAPKRDCEDVIFALKQMSAEHLEAVQELSKPQRVPNLQSGRATLAHLEFILAAMDQVEKGATPG